MKVFSAEVTNFGSYPHLKFEFDGLGLTLVSGLTGAGKSTLLDIIPWCLFGVTAKNGSVEDVRSWQADAGVTQGFLCVETTSGIIRIVRVRGSPAINDLYWVDELTPETYSQNQHRGKDLNDTQKLLEQRLGISAETFLASTYFHEFSSTGNFFTAAAKTRRELFDRVCDLSFPVKLSAAANDLRRGARTAADALKLESSKLEGRISELERSQVTSRVSSTRWDDAQKEKIAKLEAKAATFEADKVARIAALEVEANDWIVKATRWESQLEFSIGTLKSIVKDPEQFESNSEACRSCGAMPTDFYARRQENDRNLRELERQEFDLEETKRAKNPLLREIETAVASENTYVDTLKVEQTLQNPFQVQFTAVCAKLERAKEFYEEVTKVLGATETRIQRLTRLIDLTGSLRGELLRKSVREIEAKTNAYLEKHFDAEIRVGFTVGDADSLDVSIHKSGYECNYKQLSRGQRSLLRLCFSVAIMKAAANAAGQHFNILAFDEVLDGLSVDLKVKAVGLFEQLATEHSTVLVVDHATEVKAAFNRQFIVEMVGDVSQVSES